MSKSRNINKAHGSNNARGPRPSGPRGPNPGSHKPIRNEDRQRRIALVVVFAMLAAIAVPAVLLVLSVL